MTMFSIPSLQLEVHGYSGPCCNTLGGGPNGERGDADL